MLRKRRLDTNLLLSCLLLLSSCSIDNQSINAGLKQEQQPSFRQVYRILETNCAACHVENGTANQAWTLDTLPTATTYPTCLKSKAPKLCTTYLKLVKTEYPWFIAGDLKESPPYINACVKEESYHIGVSIPDRLSDEDCNLMKDWIMQGTIF